MNIAKINKIHMNFITAAAFLTTKTAVTIQLKHRSFDLFNYLALNFTMNKNTATFYVRHANFPLLCGVKIAVITTIFSLLISPVIYAESAKIKTSGVNLVGGNFPALSKSLEAPAKPSKGASPCDLIKALRINELAGNWKSIVASIELKCEIGKGIEDEPDANTLAIAKLKPKAAHFDGINIIEIRMSDSAWGNDYQYVLDARFSSIQKQLKSAIRKNCIKQRGITAPITDNICRVENDGQHGGLYLDTGEGGGIWLHADPGNPNRTIYASAWSE